MTHLHVAVLARAAVAGQAKTRLIPALGAERAAALQAHLTERALRRATASGAEVVLWVAGDVDAGTRALACALAVDVRQQPAGDLGARMLAALEHASGRAALVIGTDCPAQSASDLEQAGMLLASHDVVLQPAHDGGYVLIGMKRPVRQLFNDITWGSASVFEQTRQRAAALGLRCAQLPALPDLDRPDDLARAVAQGWIDAQWT
jgi:rSAM/selenodomain-associated transferase 1